MRFRRVRCPAELVEISGSTPRDDDEYEAVDLDAYVVQLLTEHARADLQLEALWDPRRRDPQAEPPPE